MSAVVLLYRPELGRILKELKFCYPAEGAMWLEQMVYWCRKKMGYLMRDGRRFIYNAYDDWTKDQITTLSSWKFGKMIRQFRQWGWITTACFAHLKDEFVNPDEVPEEFHPYNTSTWVSLNEKVIEEVIGWNAFAQETDTLTGTNSSENLNPFPSTEIANATAGDCKRNEAKLQRQKRSIYKDYQNITKSIPKIDFKKSEEGNQEVDNSTNQVEILTTTKEQKEVRPLIAESLSEAQNSGALLDSDEKIKLTQQFLVSLNTKVEQQEQSRSQQGLSPFKPIRISGLDEEVHEILWKHQAQLENLNADLNASRIQNAIADNPQHLEDAIYAFKENSAKGAKTKEAATGFLFNALCRGWKPRQPPISVATSVQVYTPPPQMLEEHKPPTLEQLVERKRLMWQNASILRPGVEAWVHQTPGVIMTPDGPALADATTAPLQPDLDPNASEHLETPAPTDKTPPEESAEEPELNLDPPLAVEQSQEISSDKPQQELHPAELISSHQTPPPLETAEEAASAAEESPLPTTPPLAKQKQRSDRQLQPVEILTNAGEWVRGYFVHSCIAVANLIGTERQYTLFDADGETYGFLGQIRPPQNTAGAT